MTNFIEDGKLYGVYSMENLETQLKIWDNHLEKAMLIFVESQKPDFHIRKNYGDSAANNWTTKAMKDIDHYQELVDRVTKNISILKGTNHVHTN